MKRLVIILAILICLIVGVFGVLGFWINRSLTAPKEHDKAETYIVIEKGSSPSAIVSKLTAEGILRSPTPTLLYLKTFGNPAALKAGEYRFPSPITAMQALAILEKGEERATRMVIPEGFTRFDIAKRIAEFVRENSSDPTDANEREILAIMNDAQKFAVVHRLAPQAENLEGYLYPSTYNFSPTATPQLIIVTMVDQFGKVWKPEWTERAKALNRTPHEIVTIASLIETESGVLAERPIVASVIYNRLNKGIALGIDQTAVYIAKMENRWDGTIHRSDLESTSPYNTRKYAGLPPGPISSVSDSAIEAALNPATTDYIYYVRNVQLNDGSHWFYASAAEFEKGKAQYQRWLEKERQEKRANQNVNTQ